MDNKIVLQKESEDKRPGVSPSQLPDPLPEEPVASTLQSDAVAKTQQPAPFQYRYFINPLLYNSIPYYGYMNYRYPYYQVPQGSTMNFIAAPPEIYTPQKFENEKLFRAMYGSEASKRDRRKFRRYLRSEQYAEDVDKFNDAEHRKYLDSLYRYTTHLNYMYNKAQNPQEPTPSKYANDPNFNYWTTRAKQFGFNSMDDVAVWQKGVGLKVDGKMGPTSEKVYWKTRNVASVNPSIPDSRVKIEDSKPKPPSVDNNISVQGVPTNLLDASKRLNAPIERTIKGVYYLNVNGYRVFENGVVFNKSGQRVGTDWAITNNGLVIRN